MNSLFGWRNNEVSQESSSSPLTTTSSYVTSFSSIAWRFFHVIAAPRENSLIVRMQILNGQYIAADDKLRQLNEEARQMGQERERAYREAKIRNCEAMGILADLTSGIHNIKKGIASLPPAGGGRHDPHRSFPSLMQLKEEITRMESTPASLLSLLIELNELSATATELLLRKETDYTEEASLEASIEKREQIAQPLFDQISILERCIEHDFSASSGWVGASSIVYQERLKERYERAITACRTSREKYELCDQRERNAKELLRVQQIAVQILLERKQQLEEALTDDYSPEPARLEWH